MRHLSFFNLKNNTDIMINRIVRIGDGLAFYVYYCKLKISIFAPFCPLFDPLEELG